MPNNFTLMTAAKSEDRAIEGTLPLMDQTCSSQFLLQPNSSAKVCLFFHGFTATPAQFLPIGHAFFEAGYNVLIPLLPGHGLAGDWDGDCPPPLPEDPKTYQTFGAYWLKQAQQFGDKVVIGGLSGGSTLAAWLALEYPDLIDRALLFAPYLSNRNKVVDWVVRLVNIYFEWKTNPEVAHFGYDGFSMPALRAFLELGQLVLDRAEQTSAAPMLIVSSESDMAVSPKDHQALFESVVKHQPKAWYHCFEDGLAIQHNMMTEAEGNKCLDLVISIAKAYAESDLTWAEVEAVRDRITQGASFDAALAELNLSDRASSDLLTLVTLSQE